MCSDLCLCLKERLKPHPVRTETKGDAPAVNKMAKEIKKMIVMPGLHSFFVLTFEYTGSNLDLIAVTVIVVDDYQHQRQGTNQSSNKWKHFVHLIEFTCILPWVGWLSELKAAELGIVGFVLGILLNGIVIDDGASFSLLTRPRQDSLISFYLKFFNEE